MSKERAASPRFRDDEPSSPVALQPDDISLLWHIYCNGVIRSDDLYSLFPNRSQQGLSRRLNKLRKGEEPYIHRMRQPNQRLVERNGSDHFAYSLGRQGALTLRLELKVDISTQRWRSRSEQLKRNTVEHDLKVAKAVARLRCDAEAADDIKMLYQQEFEPELQNKQPKTAGRPNTLRARIDRWPRKSLGEGTAPDAICAVSQAKLRRYLFMEIDQATETIVPSMRIIRSPGFWRRSSVLRKFVIYAHAFEQRAHLEQFGYPAFQVITLVPNEERIGHMKEAITEHLPWAKNGFFLFASWEQIHEWQKTIYDFPFQSVSGKDFFLGNQRDNG